MCNSFIGIPDLVETYITHGPRARHRPNCFTKEYYFQVEIFRAALDTHQYFQFKDKVMHLLYIH
jgi:hypothetical protein